MKKNYFDFKKMVIIFLLLALKMHSQCGSPATVPYHEGFDNITVNGQLPPCWSASNLGITCSTYSGSNGSAAFYYNPAATSYFYSSGIQLFPGVTYSASVLYVTDFSGSTNWTNLSILLGTSQTPTGLVNIASTPGPALSNIFTALSNTFTVASAGVYYIAIKATGNTSGASQFLIWDDLNVTAPCSLANNSPTISISANSTTLCSGQPYSQLTFTANGASTYTWNTGSSTAITQALASVGNTYIVSGTHAFSGCSSSASISISVFPTPNMTLIVSASSICYGKPVTFNAYGANTYTWSDGQTGAIVSMTPNVSTIYTVTGISNAGCSTSEPIAIGVIPAPTITHSASSVVLCANESLTLTADGAITYTWTAPGGNASTNNPYITTAVSGDYTLTGKDGNGCVNSDVFQFAVDLCVGLNGNDNSSTVPRIYPNPTEGDLSIEVKGETIHYIYVIDLSGRIVFETDSTEKNKNILLDTRKFKSGIYFIKTESGENTHTIKMIKL